MCIHTCNHAHVVMQTDIHVYLSDSIPDFLSTQGGKVWDSSKGLGRLRPLNFLLGTICVNVLGAAPRSNLGSMPPQHGMPKGIGR